MTRHLAIPNWAKFQHYKDQRPVWIKFYVALLDKPEWLALSDIARAQLVGCWMLAAKRGNRLPTRPQDLRVLIGSRSPVRLHELLDGGWLEYVDDSAGETRPESRLTTRAGSRETSKGESSPHARPRTREEGEREEETERETAPSCSSSRARAVALVTAANQAVTLRFGEQAQPILASHGPSHQLAAWVEAQGIPVPFAQRSIARQVAAKAGEPPRNMAYFRPGIRDDWEAQSMRDAERDATPVVPLERAPQPGGRPASLGRDVADIARRAAERLTALASEREDVA